MALLALMAFCTVLVSGCGGGIITPNVVHNKFTSNNNTTGGSSTGTGTNGSSTTTTGTTTSGPSNSPSPTPTPSGSPTPPFVATPTWVPMGPNPLNDIFGQQQAASGRLWAVAVNPGNASTILVGTAGGGIWRSTDSGTTWTPQTDNLGSLSISCIVFDPTDGTNNTVYAGTGEPVFTLDAGTGIGVLKSSNGGVTWTPMSTKDGSSNELFTGLAISNLGVDSTGVVYAGVYPNAGDNAGTNANFVSGGTFGRIVKSSAAHPGTSTTWTDLTGNLPGSVGTDVIGVSDVVINSSNGNLLVAVDGSFAGNNGDTGVYVSTDSGGTFNAAVNFSSANSGYTRLAVSKGGGLTWALTTDPIGASFAAISSTSGLYAGFSSTLTTTGMTLLNSTTAGSSMGDYRLFCQNLDDTGTAIENAQASYDLAICADTNNANTCYIAAQQVVRIDQATSSASASAIALGGLSPTTAGPGTAVASPTPNNFGQVVNKPHTDDHFLGMQNNTLFVGCDGGVNALPSPAAATPTSTSSPFNNSNIVWNNLDGNQQTLQFYSVAAHPSQAQFIAGGMQDNGVGADIFTTNGGNTIGGLSSIWPELAGGDGGNTLFDQTTGLSTYSSLSDSQIFRLDVDTSGNFTNFAQATGINLGTQPSFFTLPIALTPQDATHMLAATDRVYESTNANTTLSFNSLNSGALVSGQIVSALAYCPTNDNVIYATTTDQNGAGAVFTRTTAGSQLTKATGSGLPSTFNPSSVSVDPANSQHAVITNAIFANGAVGAASVGSLVFETTDGGSTWKDISGTLPNYPAMSIALDPNHPGTFYVGNSIGVFVTTNDGANWSRYGTGLPNAVVWQIALGKQGQLIAGTHGRSAWETSTNGNLTISAIGTTASSIPPAGHGLAHASHHVHF
jgi:hypothetical protein